MPDELCILNDEKHLGVYVSIHIPETTALHGFVVEGRGAHTSRTIMLAELRLLLNATPPTANQRQYRTAILEDNVLLKKTVTTRRESLARLRELYGLDRGILLFRAMRDLWDQREAQPLLALLCALARDPILRVTSDFVLTMPPSLAVTGPDFADVVRTAFPDRFNAITLATIGRNAASSWQQSGHLEGIRQKTRSQITSQPAAVAYALLLGYLCGERGANLFTTTWAQLLDTPQSTLDLQAFAASQRGWIDYRRIGDVVDISFSWLMRAMNGDSVDATFGWPDP